VEILWIRFIRNGKDRNGMRPKSWIVIGIILFVIMTLNNLWVIANTGPELDMALAELWKMRNFENALLIFVGLYVMWLIYTILHIFSVIMIAIGVIKTRNEKLDADIQDRLGFTKPKPAKQKPVEKKETSAFCENCGNTLKSTAKFCGSCGNQV